MMMAAAMVAAAVRKKKKNQSVLIVVSSLACLKSSLGDISLISKRVSMSLSSPLLPSGGKGPPTEGQDSIVTAIFAPAILAILSGDERGRCRYSHGVRTHSAQIHVIILHLHA
jgi:hypothetical protein